VLAVFADWRCVAETEVFSWNGMTRAQAGSAWQEARAPMAAAAEPSARFPSRSADTGTDRLLFSRSYRASTRLGSATMAAARSRTLPLVRWDICVERGVGTPDTGGTHATDEVVAAVLAELSPAGDRVPVAGS
jgi:hypothetical protein